ncbi:MAG: ABC transporter ATP-binding protein [Spirochaetia bacterium]
MGLHAIEVEHVYKKFTRSLRRGLYYGLVDSLKTMAGMTPQNSVLRDLEFWALKDINFVLEPGKSLGLLGVNGSGKSTLLRLIAGIYPPSQGTLRVRGRVGSLIAVGAGFHAHMTGRENVFLNGSILGMSRTEIKKHFDEIVDFAQVGDFIDSPVATYSSGMTLRLAFSIAVHGHIDILLADEILAVGDQSFRDRCAQRMKELQKSGVSLILVSHMANQIAENCDQSVLINKGVQSFFGDVYKGLSHYQDIQDVARKDHQSRLVNSEGSVVHIEKMTIESDLINQKIILSQGQKLQFCIHYRAEKDYDQIDVRIIIQVPFFHQNDYMQTSNLERGILFNIKKGSGHIHVSIDDLPFSDIDVTISIEIWDRGIEQCLYSEHDIRVQKKQHAGITGHGVVPVTFLLSSQ